MRASPSTSDSPGAGAVQPDHAHTERGGKPSHLGADLTEADDQQRVAGQLIHRGAPPSVGTLVGEQANKVLANASSPSSANSASGPAWMPAALATTTRASSSPLSCAAPTCSPAPAAVAGPTGAPDCTNRLGEPFRRVARDPNSTSAAPIIAHHRRSSSGERR